MTDQLRPSPKEIHLPEQLEASRHVGFISSDQFPWLDRPEGRVQVAVTELKFNDGLIYVASAGTQKLNRISEEMQNREKQTANDGYNRLDSYWMQACHLEANGNATNSEHIKLVKGGVSPEFKGLALKDWRESNKPNTRRIYYAMTSLSHFSVSPASGVPSTELKTERPLLIRLGITDKQHQLEVLARLTGQSRRVLKNQGAGSV